MNNSEMAIGHIDNGLDQVDQGTLFMFSLVVFLILVVTLYFTCTWYHKKQAKNKSKTSPDTKDSTDGKVVVNRTFSRFSQVDEELTVVMPDELDDDDRELIMNSSIKLTQQQQQDTSDTHVNVDRAHSDNNQAQVKPTSAVQVERPPYLETDM